MKPTKSNEISARKKNAAQAAEACVDVFGGTWLENIIRSSEMRSTNLYLNKDLATAAGLEGRDALVGHWSGNELNKRHWNDIMRRYCS